MSARIATVLGVAYLVLGTNVASAQVTAVSAPTQYTNQVQQARKLIREYLTEDSLPGISVAVAVDGNIIWSEGFGFANVEHRVPVVPTTRFRVGSTSKALTAGAFGLLVEQGKIDLDAPVQRYVPSFPKKRWPITVRQLAGHQTGIRAYNILSQPEPRPGPFANLQGFVQTKHYNSVVDALELFQNDPLLFEPGTQFHYTSFGTNLLSAVIEGAAGEDFLSYMKTHVFDPLGMRYTAADQVGTLIDQRTAFYSRGPDGTLIPAPYTDNSYKWAGGGFLSTPEDLVRYASAYLGDRFLKPETVKLLFTPQRTRDGKETVYGMHWMIEHDKAGRLMVSHGGGAEGGRSHLVIYPEQRVVVSVLMNLAEVPGRIVEKTEAVAQVFMPGAASK